MSPRPQLPRQDCAHCGRHDRCTRVVLEKAVCQRCTLRFARTAQPCPGCGHIRVLAFYDDRRRPACAACTGNETVYACTACGREDSPWGRLCGHCALQEKATVLLSSPDGVIHPRLRPVYDALISGPRPQSTLYWFTRSTGPATLGAMARGELDISHATFEAMPASRTNSYLRDLLTALGVLPPFHAELERVSPWLEELLSTLPAGQSEVLARFARWQVLSRLRRQEHHGTLTHGAISAARATIVVTARFMDWLTEDGTDLTDIGQGDLDRYAQQHRARALALRPFLAWRARTGLGGNLSVATRPSTQPAVTLSDEDRWAHVQLLLHDDTIRLYTRVAGLFVLLYAQPLARVVRMRAHQITVNPDGVVTATFDTFPIELPDPLDRLVRTHLTRRGQASYASRAEIWLFPGGIPGKHLATENVRAQLVERGIQPMAARNAAMFQLAASMPTPILADILGLAPNTATRWAALASRGWSTYTAQRDTHLRRADPYEADASESAATSCCTVGDPATPSGVRYNRHDNATGAAGSANGSTPSISTDGEPRNP
ncbi:hypothetical protein ACPYOC_17470 [Ornithinimicrobium sp. W1665]|uniref:hypothetical protein n=1 Tax=Ornithinimicrobium sp. W1665 TaxID=3416666 RepID=UPI003CE7C1B0